MTGRHRLIARVAFWGGLATGAVAFILVCLTSHVDGPFHESSAITAIRMYLGAQNLFHREAHYGLDVGPVYANPRDGTGFPDLWRIGGPEGEKDLLRLIPLAFAAATSPDRPSNGYYFVDIAYDDYSTQHGICAVPAEHKRYSRNTYVADVTGRIYCKDNGGRPVTTRPDLAAEGWKQVDLE